jgi:hypothetical protein
MEVKNVVKDDEITITISLNADDIIALKNDLNGVQGVLDWFSNGPAAMKVLNCRDRMIKTHEHLLMDDSMTVAELRDLKQNPIECARKIFFHPSYKDRQARIEVTNGH